MDVAATHTYTHLWLGLCCFQISDFSLSLSLGAREDTLQGKKWVNKTWEWGKYPDYLLSWPDATSCFSYHLPALCGQADWLTDRQSSRPPMYGFASGRPLICMRTHLCFFLHYIPFPGGERRYELWEIKFPPPAAQHIIKQARFNTSWGLNHCIHLSPPHRRLFFSKVLHRAISPPSPTSACLSPSLSASASHTHTHNFPHQEQSLWWLPVMHIKTRWHLRVQRGHTDKST